MSPLTEDDWHRRQIDAFRLAEPIKVKLSRPVYEKTSTGGRVLLRTDVLPEQIFRITRFKRRLTLEYEFARDGEEVKNIHYVLIGAHDADVQVNDYFRFGGRIMEVKFLDVLGLHRRAFGVVVRGEEVNP